MIFGIGKRKGVSYQEAQDLLKIGDAMGRIKLALDMQQSENTRLQSTITQQSAKISELEKEVEAWEKRFAHGQLEAVKLQESLTAARAKVAEMEAKSERTKKLIRSQADKLHDLNQQLQHVIAYRDSARADVRRLLHAADKFYDAFSAKHSITWLERCNRAKEDVWLLLNDLSPRYAEEGVVSLKPVVEDNTTIMLRRLETATARIAELEATNKQLEDEIMGATKEVVIPPVDQIKCPKCDKVGTVYLRYHNNLFWYRCDDDDCNHSDPSPSGLPTQLEAYQAFIQPVNTPAEAQAAWKETRKDVKP